MSINVEIRLIDADILMERRELDELPGIGEEIMFDGVVYQTATTPSDVVGGEAIIYVRRVTDA
jgi:hypothetical protein